MKARLAQRYAAETRFRRLGLMAVLISTAMLAFLLGSMSVNGWRGFIEACVSLPIDFTETAFEIDADALRGPRALAALNAAGVDDLTAVAAEDAFGANGADYVASSAWKSVRGRILAEPELVGSVVEFQVPISDEFERARDGIGDPALVAAARALDESGRITSRFNSNFLTGSDATDPTDVGLWGALKGSIMTMLVTLVLAFPIGVLAAIYLEEFAPKNRWTDAIEVSINNLAAVPSIIFGLLGLAIFLNTFGLPRSAPLVGGMTLALMTMPVIVIAGRNAIKSVPPSIRDAALGIGASPIQTVAHHVLPAALPGIMTASIIGMARALGETAPLLMIGMRAFVATPPSGINDPATVLPMQIFLWSDEVDPAFVQNTAAAIIVLLVFLLAMNGLAIYLRNKYEVRW